MIIDDDRTTTTLVKQLLELDGFEVKIHAQGKEAFSDAPAFSPDIFLVDFHLADMEGIDLVQQFRATEKFAKTPIVMASGRDVERDAIKAGANLFRIKPYDPAELVDRFFELIGSKP